MDQDNLKILYRLQERTDADPAKVNPYDSFVVQVICDCDTENIPEFENDICKDIIRKTRPASVQDLFRVSGLFHGTDTWEGNAEDLVNSGGAELADLICLREDILQYLQLKGLEQPDAFRIMETVRKGKVAYKSAKDWESEKNLMLEYDVPNWYVDSCEKIHYLSSLERVTDGVLTALRMAWYKYYYPTEFAEVMTMQEY